MSIKCYSLEMMLTYLIICNERYILFSFGQENFSTILLNILLTQILKSKPNSLGLAI